MKPMRVYSPRFRKAGRNQKALRWFRCEWEGRWGDSKCKRESENNRYDKVKSKDGSLFKNGWGMNTYIDREKKIGMKREGFSDHNGIKLDINSRKYLGKPHIFSN